MKKIAIGNMMMIVAFVFSIIETNYFGNNLFPQSKMEFICDMIALTIGIIGCILVIKTTKTKIKLKN